MIQGALLFVFTMYNELHKMDCTYLLQQVCGWYFSILQSCSWPCMCVCARMCAHMHHALCLSLYEA